MEVVPSIAIKSLYRQFMDLEPVWTGLLVFNYTFSIGQPAAGVESGAAGRIDRSSAIASALQGYLNDVPDRLPIGPSFFITNNVEYAGRIEHEGSPRGYGQNALLGACLAWKRHVKLGVADAQSLVTP